MTARMLLAAALLALPVGAMAQTPQERIDGARARALQAGIPISLIEAKIAEGRAKGVSLDRMAAAIERREAALEKAWAAMGRSDDVQPAELGVAGDAIAAGVSEAVLAKLAEVSAGERRAVAIAALTQLVAAGHAPQAALDRVTEALARGGDALANLPAQAAEAAARRGPPAGVGRPATAGQKPVTTPPGNRPPVVPPGG
ncbi:MAG TPA: hypothetical protein VFZ24_04220 [Longimicrobiales bacterium]